MSGGVPGTESWEPDEGEGFTPGWGTLALAFFGVGLLFPPAFIPGIICALVWLVKVVW